jgi:hypothetical protein
MTLTEREHYQLDRLLDATNCIVKDAFETYENPNEFPINERFELWEDDGEEWECIGLFPTERTLYEWLIKKTS